MGCAKVQRKQTEPDTVAMPKTAQLEGEQGNEKKPNNLTRKMQKKGPLQYIGLVAGQYFVCLFLGCTEGT